MNHAGGQFSTAVTDQFSAAVDTLSAGCSLRKLRSAPMFAPQAPLSADVRSASSAQRPMFAPQAPLSADVRSASSAQGCLTRIGAGVEQVEAPALDVLLGLRARLDVVITAISHPAAAASLSRAASSAVWMPRRRCAGAVAAPAS